MQQNVARRPRFKRVGDLPNIRLTTRDFAILSAIMRHRFLTTSHILSLVPGSRQNIIRRLQRLYHAGFIERPKAQLPLRFAGELSELVHSPTRKTVNHMATVEGTTVSGKEYRPVTSLFLSHALLVSEALISIEAGCRTNGTVLITEEEILRSVRNGKPLGRLAWRVSLKSGNTTEKVGLIPDAVFAIEQESSSGRRRRLIFFLEADRGTMPLYRKSLRLSSIRRKALAYTRSRKTRVLKDRFGMPGFQVIFVSRSRERLERIQQMCHETAGTCESSLFLYSTADELKNSISQVNRCIWDKSSGVI